MPRRYHASPWIPTDSVGGQWVVMSHVSVNDFNFLIAHQLRKRSCAACVKRVAQRQSDYVFCWELELFMKWRFRAHHCVDTMSTRGQSIGQIREMTLPATKRLS